MDSALQPSFNCQLQHLRANSNKYLTILDKRRKFSLKISFPSTSPSRTTSSLLSLRLSKLINSSNTLKHSAWRLKNYKSSNYTTKWNPNEITADSTDFLKRSTKTLVRILTMTLKLSSANWDWTLRSRPRTHSSILIIMNGRNVRSMIGIICLLWYFHLTNVRASLIKNAKSASCRNKSQNIPRFH